MRPILALLAVWLFLAPARVHAQQEEDAAAARFQLAESYLRAGQYDRAIALLEQLYASDSNSFVFYDRLKTAYENVKRYDDAVDLIEARLGAAPSPMLMAEKARMIYLSGDEAGAFRTWDEAVEMAPQTRSTYQVVYRSLADARLLDRSIDLLLSARRRLNDPALFRPDLNALFMMTGRYDEAVREQLAMLRDDARQLNNIIASLARQADQREALEAARTATEDAVREDPLNRGLRELLSWIYLETGDYAAALNENRAIDRLEKQEGRVLLGFAQRATGAGAFEAAETAYQEILERYPDGDAAPHAMYGLGSLHEAWAEHLEEQNAPAQDVALRLRAALEAYDRFAQEHPRHAYYPVVLRNRGRLQLEALRDLPAARLTLEEVVERFVNTDEAHGAQLDLGRIDVLDGDFDSAILRFNRLVDELRLGDVAERARFELARVHFYRGEFDAARTLLNVLEVNTSTDVANDALELKLVIIENPGSDSLNLPLRRFAEIQLEQRRGHHQQALEMLDELLRTDGHHPIADEARFARADALEMIGEVEAASAAFEEIPQFHPESYLADRSLYRAALIHEIHRDDPQAAVDVLTRLLTAHPGSTLAQTARDRIRRLRGDAL